MPQLTGRGPAIGAAADEASARAPRGDPHADRPAALGAPHDGAARAAERSGAPWAEALWVSADVTLVVGAIVVASPPGWHAILVAFAFLLATWMLVWRRDDDQVRRAGLALGGLLIPGRLDVRAAIGRAARAGAWALGCSALVAVPYFVGWRIWYEPRLAFALSVRPAQIVDDALGQLLVIALPEEAFYRGYLQSRFDQAWPPRWRLFGAPVGPGLLAAAAIFALGHVATVPLAARLAVFFPALVFGWLRARTGGIGSSALFHTLCNVYAQLLGQGFGVY